MHSLPAFWMWCFSSSSLFHGSPAQFNNFNNFYGVGCENCQCNFAATSCFDLLYIVMRVKFGSVPVTMLLRILLCGLISRVQCPDFVTVNLSGSPKVTALSLLKSKVIFAVFHIWADGHNCLKENDFLWENEKKLALCFWVSLCKVVNTFKD